MSTARIWRIVAVIVTPVLVFGLVVATGGGTSLFGGSRNASATRATKQACASVVSSVVATTQRFVAGFDADVPTLPGPVAGGTVPIDSPMTQDEFTKALTSTRSRLDSLGCDMKKLRADLGKGLQHVQGKGALAQALVRQLRVSLSGKLPDGPVTRTVGPSGDVDQALAEMPEGSTLVLAAGSYQRSQPLVLLRSITISGAGAAATTVTSSAGGVTVLVMGGTHVALKDLAITPSPSTVASAVLAGAGAAVTLTHIRIRGMRSDGKGHGGSGVLVAGTVAANRTDVPKTSVDIDASEFTDNDAAGVALAGVTSASVRNSTFRRNGECGVCFIGASAGTVQGDTFRHNAVGVAVTSTSHPVLRGNTFRGERFAVQATDRSQASIIDNDFAQATGAAILYLGRAAGRSVGNRCANNAFDIVLRTAGRPVTMGGSCQATPLS